MLCNYFHNVIPFVIISKEFPWIMCNNCPPPMCKPWPGAKTLAQNYWHTLFLPFIPSAQCTGISAVKLDKPLWPQIDHIGADEGALSALLWSWLLHSQATNKHIGTHYMCRWSAKCTRNVTVDSPWTQSDLTTQISLYLEAFRLAVFNPSYERHLWFLECCFTVISQVLQFSFNCRSWGCKL